MAVAEWTFLTNHARILLCIAEDPDTRIRDMAQCADITERAAHRILCDLIEAGYVSRQRRGSRNHYEVHPEMPLRHAHERGHQIGEVLRLLGNPERPRAEDAA